MAIVQKRMGLVYSILLMCNYRYGGDSCDVTITLIDSLTVHTDNILIMFHIKILRAIIFITKNFTLITFF